MQICQVAHGHLCRRVTGEEKKQPEAVTPVGVLYTYIRNTRPDPGDGVGGVGVAVRARKTRWPRRGPPENDFASSEHAT